MKELNELVQWIKDGGTQTVESNAYVVYPNSLRIHESDRIVMIKDRAEHAKKLVVVGKDSLFQEFDGEKVDEGVKLCLLSHENRLILNKYFPYTVPQAFGTKIATIGLGDRLGLASPGHIQTVINKDIKPILAQQSIRELNLTGRTYSDVLDAACYAVFQEGYEGGFGADGDHLKVEADIEYALSLGFTMLTLDCSDQIDQKLEQASEAEIEAAYGQLDETRRTYYEEKYLDRPYQTGDQTFKLDQQSLQKIVLVYGEAIEFMEHIYNTYLREIENQIDFEVSIDETHSQTAPNAHFLIAQELIDRNINVYSIAPRFVGEFQKGIDYIGDLTQFEKELQEHAALADHFGYKLSIHSGSDKFSVFSMIGKYTGGRFHVKTAGTNWLEAMRTIARYNPSLYRAMHLYAIDHFDEARSYYDVKAELAKIKPLDSVSDADLHTYMDDDDARQLIHITYGILLQAKDESGQYLFKTKFERTLSEFEQEYEDALKTHIGKHLSLLGK